MRNRHLNVCGLAVKQVRRRHPTCSDQRRVWKKQNNASIKSAERERGGETEGNIWGDVVQTASSVHVQTDHGHRGPQPCLPARSGLAPVTTVVPRHSPHANFMDMVFLLWLVVLCKLPVSLSVGFALRCLT